VGYLRSAEWGPSANNAIYQCFVCAAPARMGYPSVPMIANRVRAIELSAARIASNACHSKRRRRCPSQSHSTSQLARRIFSLTWREVCICNAQSRSGVIGNEPMDAIVSVGGNHAE
jgi:hypothetical protein